MKDKKELIRVVRSADGSLSIDATGKKAGRGAYLCPNPECFEKAVRTKGLERSLQVSIQPAVYETLRNEMKKHE
jgi:hypothetical protein